MATTFKDLGVVTAYAYAVEGGYTGTEEEFEALLGNIAGDLSEIENLSVTVTGLPEGSAPTASYSSGVLALGIPKGDTGEVSEARLAEVLEDFAQIDGSYEGMTVGNAEQLVSTVGVIDKAPYLFRTSGGSADVGDRETDMLVGGTVVWNQRMLEYQSSATSNGITTVRDFGFYSVSGTASATWASFGIIGGGVVDGHVYAMVATFTKNTSSLTGFTISTLGGATSNPNFNVSVNSAIGINAKVFKSGKTITSDIIVGFNSLTANVDIGTIELWLYAVDLTQMFGSTIADYVYSLEQANEGAGVAWFKRLFPADYYAYDAGTLMSVKAAAHKLVGFNAYDNTTGKAKLIGGVQYQITGAYTALSLDGVSITPDSNGKFTPTVNGELTVTGGNGTTTCVHIVWDGERNGEYAPYIERVYPLDADLELRGLPKLDANNGLYYDGDTYESDGTVTRRYGIRAYQAGDESDTAVITDKTNTVYTLTEPTTETADPYTNPQIVDDWGTEEYVDTRTVPIPVGHETVYSPNLRAKLEMAPNSPADGDGDYIVRHTGGENEYVKLVISNELPTAPTTDGSYHLKVTVANGTPTLTWEADA